jgi:uroporphyrinogen-III synthase
MSLFRQQFIAVTSTNAVKTFNTQLQKLSITLDEGLSADIVL